MYHVPFNGFGKLHLDSLIFIEVIIKMANEPHCVVCNLTVVLHSPEGATIPPVKREESEVNSENNGEENVSNYISQKDAGGNGDTSLDKQLKVIFLLRKILEVESENLESYLKSGNPDSWVRICQTCGEEIDKAWRKYQEILRAIKEFATIRNGIVKVVRDSNDAVGVGEGGTAGKKKTRGLRGSKNVEGLVSAAVRRIVNDRPEIHGNVTITYSIKNLDFPVIVPKVEAEPVDEQRLDCGLNDTEWQDDDCFNDENDNGGGYHDNQEEDPDYEAVNLTDSNPPKERVKCNLCSKICADKRGLNVHTRIKHKYEGKEPPNLTCQYCKKICSNEQGLAVHLTLRHGDKVKKPDKYTCSIDGCGKEFNLKQTYVAHMKRHNNKPEHNYKCDTCGRECHDKQNLEYHMEAHEQNAVGKMGHLSNEGEDDALKVLEDDKTLPEKDSKLGINEVLEEEIIPSSELLEEGHSLSETADVQGRFKCQFCELIFDTTKGLNIHVGWVHNNVQDRGKLPCPVEGCGREYEYSQGHLLKSHMASHTKKEMRYRCSICQKEFCGKVQFLYHKSTHNRRSERKRFSCEKEGCEKEYFTLSRLKEHLRWHSNPEKFKCPACGKKLASNLNLKSHRKLCHASTLSEPVFDGDPATGIQFPCEFCTTPFTTEKGLMMHIKSRHKTKTSNQFICPEKECGKEFGTHQKPLYLQHIAGHKQEKKFRCKLCFREFYLKSSFLSHQLAHKRGSIKLPKTEKPAEILESVKKEAREPAPKKVVCLCGRGFVSESAMRAHKRNSKFHVTGDDLEKFKCKHCNKGFVKRQTMVNHQKTHEYTDAQQYICEHCGKSFLAPHLLKAHIKRLHTGKPSRRTKGHQDEDQDPNKFQCQTCGKRFTKAKYMRVHIQFVHDKRFPVFCDLCGKGSINRQHLRLHMRMKHRVFEEGVQEYKCGVPGCIGKYFEKERYDRHMREVHPNGEDSPFTFNCEQCGRGFWRKNRLQEHLGRHEKSKRKESDKDEKQRKLN